MKSVIITGSSSGLGLSLSNAFIELGYKVIGLSRSKTPIENHKFRWIKIDINDHRELERVIESIKSVDILINNAGYAKFGPIVDIEIEEFEKQFTTNLFSHIKIIQLTLNKLKKSDNPKIVNIGSMSGLLATPLAGAYCSSKAGFNILTDTLRMELKAHGINVIKVIPGVFKSNFGNGAMNQINPKTSSFYSQLNNTLNKRVYISQSMETDTDRYGKILSKKIIKAKNSRTLYFGKGVVGGMIFKLLIPQIIRENILLKFYPLRAKED